MDKIFLTTDIITDMTAASKARVDVLNIMQKNGYTTVYLPAHDQLGELMSFWRLLSKQVTRKSHLVMEYPCWMRKRIYLVYLFCFFHRIKVYGIIHDIGALRLNTSLRAEMAVLKLFGGLVSHNPVMTRWLKENGITKKIVDLNLFDYCLSEPGDFHQPELSEPVKLLYAGNLSYSKATYLYNRRLDKLEGLQLCVYGQYFEQERMNGSKIVYKGIFDSSAPRLQEKYHFGLIWEGTSIDTCEGDFGNYTRYNNPHKFSLYISLGLPVIVWKEAAIASFVIDNNIGFTISSLEELGPLLKELSPQQYLQYADNVLKISPKVHSGYYLTSAITKLVNA